MNKVILPFSGGGGGAWGGITGTLSDQTDLQTALDSKTNRFKQYKAAFNQFANGSNITLVSFTLQKNKYYAWRAWGALDTNGVVSSGSGYISVSGTSAPADASILINSSAAQEMTVAGSNAYVSPNSVVAYLLSGVAYTNSYGSYISNGYFYTGSGSGDHAVNVVLNTFSAGTTIYSRRMSIIIEEVDV